MRLGALRQFLICTIMLVYMGIRYGVLYAPMSRLENIHAWRVDLVVFALVVVCVYTLTWAMRKAITRHYHKGYKP